MTTHRVIQLSVLLDNLESKYRTLGRIINKAAGRGNLARAVDATKRQARLGRVCCRIRLRLEGAA